MNKIIIGLILCAFLAACTTEITNFNECVSAGNPIMESYPRQCAANGKTFSEVIDATDSSKIGCESKVGSWLADARECEAISEEDCIGLGGIFNECGSACRNDPSAEVCTMQCVPFCSFAEQTIGGDKDEHGCLIAAGYSWCSEKQKCIRTWEESCEKNSDNYCTLESREAAGCNKMLAPVCGWFNSSIKCFKYPRAASYDNSCLACLDSKVSYWTEGSCPLNRKLTLDEAKQIAITSECSEKGTLTDESVYNENSRTWWITLKMKPEFEKEICNPACVISDDTKTAEINWRCTGLLPS